MSTKFIKSSLGFIFKQEREKEESTFLHPLNISKLFSLCLEGFDTL